MLSPDEYEEIRAVVRKEMVAIEEQMVHAGSYSYLCDVAGQPTFTHHAVGSILRYQPHPHTDPEPEPV